MNNLKKPEDEQRSLQILDELSGGASITQRDLSRRLGIALGLVNSYIKNLVTKGYVTVKAIPPKRYAYYLTPKGFAEKTRLTFHLLNDYTRIYREAKNNLKEIFSHLISSGVKRVVFAGVDEVTEIAYLTLQETGMILAGVADNEKVGQEFFGNHVVPFEDINRFEYDAIIVTSYLRRGQVLNALLDLGIDEGAVRMIWDVTDQSAPVRTLPSNDHVISHDGYIRQDDWYTLNRHKSGLVWFTGLSASGKSTIAHGIQKELYKKGVRAYVLDGDNVRHGLNANLGFSPEDQKEDIRRIVEVSKLFVDAGIFVIAAFISPIRKDRKQLPEGKFMEVYVKCPVDVCETRDPKGQYKKARAGIIKNYTGINAPYEEPESPELILETAKLNIDQSVNLVMELMNMNGFITGHE